MVGIWRVVSGAAAAAILFGFGMIFQSWRSDERLKAEPCDVRQWFPNEGTFREVSAERSDCLLLGPATTVSGIWMDDPYSGGFTADVKAGLPHDLDLYMDSLTRVRAHYSAGSRGLPEQFSGRRYQVTVSGRLGRSDELVLDGHQNVFVVDEIKQIRLLADDGPPLAKGEA